MDHKITLSIDEAVIEKAKKYAKSNNISLSGLVEYLLREITSSFFHSFKDYPISEWVKKLLEEKQYF
jgi:hypothetical protein